MDILFCHLQVHLETLYYKFAPYHKNAVVNVRNGYRDQANYKKEVYLSKKPPTISIPKTKASPCHNYNINNQYSNGFQSKVNIPSTYSNKSVLYMVSHLISHFHNRHYFSLSLEIVIYSMLINYVLHSILAQRRSCSMGSFG